MKNKEKYNILQLEFRKRKITKNYSLKFVTEVYLKGKMVAVIQGGATSDIFNWLEEDVNGTD